MDSSSNTVGGTAAGARNVISGNTGVGILVSSDGTMPASGNLIAGNLIGTDSTCAKALGNTGPGVSIGMTFSDTIGGSTAAARNVISGNGGQGILVTAAGTATSPALDLILGNYIGTDGTGMNALGNSLGESRSRTRWASRSAARRAGRAT